MAGPTLLKNPIYSVYGVDAQAPIGNPRCREEEGIIGDATSGSRACKGNEFTKFALERNLRVLNTFSSDTVNMYACHHDFRAEANQIDYILSDLP